MWSDIVRELTGSVRPLEDGRHPLYVMCMRDEIYAKRDEIYAIAKKHKAEKLWVFGSCARKAERHDSDVDLLVKFGGEIGLVEYVQLERELSQLLGRKVELTVNSALLREPRFAARVLPAEYLAAISVQTGRAKDKLRVQSFLSSARFDRKRFAAICAEHGLVCPDAGDAR